MNRLSTETSPYLLQHASNPVDWYPWGQEAFDKARKENKLILLSSGYSTCHWCHVMERESFKDDATAAILNKHFVAIKLDREERPDVDQIYMTAHSAMSGGSGGWPLNMFLLPNLQPIYGGTYFPPHSKQGRPGFPQVLEHLAAAWEKTPDDLKKSGADFTEKLESFLSEKQQSPLNPETEAILAAARQNLMSSADLKNGGLGEAPKFPQVSTLRFLLHSHDQEARDHILFTCDKMQAAGIHDQLGGGFHRYAVDDIWLVPHFEKMLYDQAQLLELYLDATLIAQTLEKNSVGQTGLSPLHKRATQYHQTAHQICHYLLTEMLSPEGAFYSAQDAQSEGKEGKYWCWTTEELLTLLTEEEFSAVKKHYGLTDKGNFLDFSDPEPLQNQNVLSIITPLDEFSPDDQVLIQSGIAKMKAVRAKRVPPMTDTKILTSWNGLTIGALARAAHILDEPKYLEAAERAHSFIHENMWNEETQHLHHCYCEGRLDNLPQAESHLFLLRGTRQLYEATLNDKYLTFAIQLADSATTHFNDKKNGGFYNSTENKNLILRLKGDYDGASPTVSSVAALEYLLLAELTGNETYRDIGLKTLQSHATTLNSSPHALSEMLTALPLKETKPNTLIITPSNSETVGRIGLNPLQGHANQKESGRELNPQPHQLFNQLLKASHQSPNRHLLRLTNTGPINDLAKSTPNENQAQAILCSGKTQTCHPPTIDSKKLIHHLNHAK